MPRENGWLKADALRTAGVREQYAKRIDREPFNGALVSVELAWDGNEYVVTSSDGTMFYRYHCMDNLDVARSQFENIVKGLK